ncbi:hypothetical protein [Burkholderia multivorans]|uniref:hypothetical protein n=1 Tax=Burkholderia multivorans TaxID=87883 RepID=UPI001C21F96B|nr:hypothetical protein [Burkholderia multivorans]MBU9317205.1 hypothetical protein [Burkholderia multivorans]MBU9624736.1 hypothetical protein [Burkholderia multivorans]
MKIHGLPQPLTGDELITIAQEQNGRMASCSMPLAIFTEYLVDNWFKNLPTGEPSSPGLPWNNNGVVSIS